MVGKGVRGRNYLTPQRQCKVWMVKARLPEPQFLRPEPGVAAKGSQDAVSEQSKVCGAGFGTHYEQRDGLLITQLLRRIFHTKTTGRTRHLSTPNLCSIRNAGSPKPVRSGTLSTGMATEPS
jgi:hypothetical protein